MLAVIALVSLAILINVFLHRQVLHALAAVRHMVPIVLALVATHVVEIIIFGVVHALAERVSGETLTGNFDGGMGARFYYSAVTYTTVGFGDIVPSGVLRIFCACEALSGLILVGWSVSFTFVVMQYRWSSLFTKTSQAVKP